MRRRVSARPLLVVVAASLLAATGACTGKKEQPGSATATPPDPELTAQLARIRQGGAAPADVQKSFAEALGKWRGALPREAKAVFAEDQCFGGGCTVAISFAAAVPYETLDSALMRHEAFAGWPGGKFRGSAVSVDEKTLRVVWVFFRGAGAAAAPPAVAPSAKADAADDSVEYRGSVFARNSGHTCRAASPASNDLAYGKTGVKNATAAPTTVWCPITRRNSTPPGTVDRNNPSAQSTHVPAEKLDRLSVDVRFTPGAAGAACTAYGRTAGAMGGVFLSPTLSACVKNATDCSGGERTQTLTWADPFAGAPHAFVNVGVRCELPQGAGILGSVASFTGDVIPAAGAKQ